MPVSGFATRTHERIWMAAKAAAAPLRAKQAIRIRSVGMPARREARAFPQRHGHADRTTVCRKVIQARAASKGKRNARQGINVSPTVGPSLRILKPTMSAIRPPPSRAKVAPR